MDRVFSLTGGKRGKVKQVFGVFVCVVLVCVLGVLFGVCLVCVWEVEGKVDKCMYVCM